MKYLFLLIGITLFGFSENMFIITNQDGTVVKDKKIKHTQNKFFDDLIAEQKALLKQLKEIKSRKNTHPLYNKEQIVKNAKNYLGGKYVWGGTQPKGFDCSGYVKYLYEKEGIALPRTAYEQSKVGKYVSRNELKKGDLLFFLTDKKRHLPITHVGMYIGNDKFIHAASRKKGIIISSLSKSKYGKLYVKAKRIIQ
jgi:cell wall-associated NlpC family hydrolase